VRWTRCGGQKRSGKAIICTKKEERRKTVNDKNVYCTLDGGKLYFCYGGNKFYGKIEELNNGMIRIEGQEVEVFHTDKSEAANVFITTIIELVHGTTTLGVLH
jgi:hypothetical protein